MLDQPMTKQQVISMLIMFNFGSSVVMGVSTGAGQDVWAALLLASVYMLPVAFLYARIMTLNPGMNLFDMLEARLGRVLGKVATALFTWYALHLCALVLRDFSEFIQISSLLDTPQLAVLLILALVMGYAAKGGPKALGKWSVPTLRVVIGIVILTVLLSLNVMRFENILPFFEHTFGEIALDAFRIFSFPLAETVMFLGVADAVRTEDKPLRLFLINLVCVFFLMLIIVLRNLFVLGASVVAVEYFPSFVAARIINLGDFLSRIEGSISINFMLAGLTKITLCLICASRGLAKLFNVSNYKTLVMPAGLLAAGLAVILFKTTMALFAFTSYYAFYALPFQTVLPVLLWIVSEIRARRGQRVLSPGNV